MSKIKKEKITLDKLAVIIQGDFNRMEKRFDGIDSRFGNVEDRLGGVEGRLGNVENRLGSVEDCLGNVENRLDYVEKNMVTKDEFESRMNDLLTTIDAFIKEMRIYREEQLAMGVKLARHERWIEQIAQKLEIKLET